jgi:hypothetical protein
MVVMQPHAIGPFTFGVSTRVVSGNDKTPQAFRVTSLARPRSILILNTQTLFFQYLCLISDTKQIASVICHNY